MERLMSVQQLIHDARCLQGIRQTELAKALQIRSSSAISQFEKSIASISVDKLKQMASILNLNPQYITEYKGCNPFKQMNPNKVIQMFLSTNEGGSIITHGILDLIINWNERASFIALNAENCPGRQYIRCKRWKKMGMKYYALLIQDEDSNLFIFKRKDNSYFSVGNLDSKLFGETQSNYKHFTFHEERISEKLYHHIKNWQIDKRVIDPLFKTSHIINKRILFSDLLDLSAAYVSSISSDEYKSLKSNIFDIMKFTDYHEDDVKEQNWLDRL